MTHNGKSRDSREKNISIHCFYFDVYVRVCMFTDRFCSNAISETEVSDELY